jgi:hypothetical protein
MVLRLGFAPEGNELGTHAVLLFTFEIKAFYQEQMMYARWLMTYEYYWMANRSFLRSRAVDGTLYP